ncbi:MAG: CYTH domain-containing protein [Brumimicrobium sp.]|nr:CYTH domain-containing protein [Brumimicrobium sp.]
MGKEIERKFLVKKDAWEKIKPAEGKAIIQGYLVKSVDKTIRIRITDSKAFLTIKGRTTGISRPEFEYEIPLVDGQDMLDLFCEKVIDKTRYIINEKGLSWEVDEFRQPRKGLILAEIELNSEEQEISVPNWIDKEVSDDPSFYNANML